MPKHHKVKANSIMCTEVGVFLICYSTWLQKKPETERSIHSQPQRPNRPRCHNSFGYASQTVVRWSPFLNILTLAFPYFCGIDTPTHGKFRATHVKSGNMQFGREAHIQLSWVIQVNSSMLLKHYSTQVWRMVSIFIWIRVNSGYP